MPDNTQPFDGPTLAEYRHALKEMREDRELWKKSYGILKLILTHYGFDVIEDVRGIPDVHALRAKGYMPPDPALDALLQGEIVKH